MYCDDWDGQLDDIPEEGIFKCPICCVRAKHVMKEGQVIISCKNCKHAWIPDCLKGRIR